MKLPYIMASVAVKFMTASACPAQLRAPSMNGRKRLALPPVVRGLQCAGDASA